METAKLLAVNKLIILNTSCQLYGSRSIILLFPKRSAIERCASELA